MSHEPRPKRAVSDLLSDAAKRLPPFRPSLPPGAEEPLIERVQSLDGASIAIKRLPSPGGTPVVFLHGIAVNADLWDLPEVRGKDFVFRSLARVLHEKGYDIWLVNLRGCGAPYMHSTPPPGQTDWCVDHMIALDFPPLIEHVVSATGQRPFVIGASLGAMVIAGALQGVAISAAPAGQEPSVVVEPALSEALQARIAGAVLVEFPAALRWPKSCYDSRGGLRWDVLLRDFWKTGGEANFPFEVLSRLRWLEAILSAIGGVPLDWARPNPVPEPLLSILPPPAADAVRRVQAFLVQKGLGLVGTFTGHSQHRAEVILQGRRYIMDGMRAGVLRQLGKSVRKGGFVSGLGSVEHDYVANYPQITLPALVVTGGRDRIANAEVTREVFFDRISSTDKTWQYHPDIGHGEFEAAPIACAEVYPRISAWLAERRPSAIQ